MRAHRWRDAAVCRGEDPELFFAVGTTGPALLQIERARSVCDRCSVRTECLAAALEIPNSVGVWAGTTEDERKDFVRNVREARQPVPAC